MKKRQQVIAAGAAVLVIMVVAWYFVLWRPRQNSISSYKAQVATATANIQQLQLELAEASHQRKELAEAKADLLRLNQAIPADYGLASLIYYVNDAAAQSQVQFLSIAPSLPVPYAAPSYQGPSGASASAAPKSPLEEMSVSISGSGPFFSVLSFLTHLANMPRLMVVNSVSLTPQNPVANGPSPTLSFSIGAEVFTTAKPPSPQGGA